MVIAGFTEPADPLKYDLDDNGKVNLDDVCEWLEFMGSYSFWNLGDSIGPFPYLPGDANLDGMVDGEEPEGSPPTGFGAAAEKTDFEIWYGNSFQVTGKWSQADFNADGVTDAEDYIIWNRYKGRFRGDGGPPK